MQTAFNKVDLDLIRYSLVWESEQSLTKALEISEDDALLVITAAGCNVLNMLLQNPASITAIDLNKEQNRLLTFKCWLIEHFDYTIFASIMGLYGKDAVAAAWSTIAPAMSTELRIHTEAYFLKNPEGLLSSGKLENYIHAFLLNLPLETQQLVHKLVSFNTVQEQHTFFTEVLECSDFKPLFINYFDQQNLSKGRDPELFKYVKVSGGALFYERLHNMASKVLLKNNFYFRFFMFSLHGLPAQLLPACYKEENFSYLRSQLYKLHIVQGEAVSYLLSNEGKHITKAGLSNIFEYVPENKFGKACKDLLQIRKAPIRFVFWNLLQSHGDRFCQEHMLHTLSEELTVNEPCFYFNNIRVMESSF